MPICALIGGSDETGSGTRGWRFKSPTLRQKSLSSVIKKSKWAICYVLSFGPANCKHGWDTAKHQSQFWSAVAAACTYFQALRPSPAICKLLEVLVVWGLKAGVGGSIRSIATMFSSFYKLLPIDHLRRMRAGPNCADQRSAGESRGVMPQSANPCAPTHARRRG